MKLARFVFLLITIFAVGVRGAEISGFLRDNRDNGLSGFSVTADRWIDGSLTQRVAVTESTGQFRIQVEQPGQWLVGVSSADLNQRGYFSTTDGYAYVEENQNPVALRFSTRKLDFTHRVVIRLLDEGGAPLAGFSMQASIEENYTRFETNVITDANGFFTLAAVPALWRFCCLDAASGEWSDRLFEEQLVEVDPYRPERQVTFVVPSAHSTLTVTTTNLEGCDVVVSAEAYGTAFRQSQRVYSRNRPVYTFSVFDGVWTVSITNSAFSSVRPSGPFSGPVTILVTNGAGAVTLVGPPQPESFQVNMPVRTITASGHPITNASILVIDPERGSPLLPLPLPPTPFNPLGSTNAIGRPGASEILQSLEAPEVTTIKVPKGRWLIRANAMGGPENLGWDVSRSVEILSNVPPREITLVFPDSAAGPRIFGKARDQGGEELQFGWISLRCLAAETNYGYTVFTGSQGEFSTPVLPGQWSVVSSLGSYFSMFSSNVLVSQSDVEVNFEVLVSTNSDAIQVQAEVVDEQGVAIPNAFPTLSRGNDYAFMNGSNYAMQIGPGIWRASCSGNFGIMETDPYRLSPEITWQVIPVHATNLIVITRQTPCRIEGRLRDERGRLLREGYVAAWTSLNGTNYYSDGNLDSGYFSLNVFPGLWQVGLSSSSVIPVGPSSRYAPVTRMPEFATAYSSPAPRWIQVSNDVVQCDFVATNIPIQQNAILSMMFIREDGVGLGDDYITVEGLKLTSARTDKSGLAKFTVPRGQVKVSTRKNFESNSSFSYLWPAVNLQLDSASNHVVLIARTPSAFIEGTVQNARAFGVHLSITGTATIQGTNYSVLGYSDSMGRFTLPVIPGQWTLRVDDAVLNNHGIRSVAAQAVAVAASGSTKRVDFVLAPITYDFREAHFARPMLFPSGKPRIELLSQVASSCRIDCSTNLIDWIPIAMSTTTNGASTVEDPAASGEKSLFYRALWVR